MTCIFVSLHADVYTRTRPQVRYGSCLALGIACAATGSLQAYALVEPMLQDPVGFVRQGALIALAMIMVQQPNSHAKAASTRKTFATVSLPVCVCVFVCVCACVDMCLSQHVNVRTWVYVWTYIYDWVFDRVCVCDSVHVYV